MSQAFQIAPAFITKIKTVINIRPHNDELRNNNET